MFCYLDFRSFFKAYYPKSLPFAVKSTCPFEIHCKKHLSTPKTAGKTTKPIADMTKARHSSMLPGSKNWRQGGHHRDIYKYTAISRRVVGKKCPRQTRKVIWDTISVTSWHCSCRTYFKFSQLSGAISLLNQNVSRGNGGFSLTGLCKKLKNRGRVYSPWEGRADVCALPATCVVNVHIFLSKLRGFLIIQKEIESDVAFSFPERARFVSMIDRVLLSGKSVEMPSFRSKSGTWVSYDSYLMYTGTS